MGLFVTAVLPHTSQRVPQPIAEPKVVPADPKRVIVELNTLSAIAQSGLSDTAKTKRYIDNEGVFFTQPDVEVSIENLVQLIKNLIVQLCHGFPDPAKAQDLIQQINKSLDLVLKHSIQLKDTGVEKKVNQFKSLTAENLRNDLNAVSASKPELKPAIDQAIQKLRQLNPSLEEEVAEAQPVSKVPATQPVVQKPAIEQPLAAAQPAPVVVKTIEDRIHDEIAMLKINPSAESVDENLTLLVGEIQQTSQAETAENQLRLLIVQLAEINGAKKPGIENINRLIRKHVRILTEGEKFEALDAIIKNASQIEKKGLQYAYTYSKQISKLDDEIQKHVLLNL